MARNEFVLYSSDGNSGRPGVYLQPQVLCAQEEDVRLNFLQNFQNQEKEDCHQ